MTIDIKTIAERMTDEEVRVIAVAAARWMMDDSYGHEEAACDVGPILTRLTTPQPKPDDAVTGEDVEVVQVAFARCAGRQWNIRCGSWCWSSIAGWQREESMVCWSSKDDAIAQRDRLVARGELPTVNGRTATRKECGLA